MPHLKSTFNSYIIFEIMLLLFFSVFFCFSCEKKSDSQNIAPAIAASGDSQLASAGSFEVSARLTEISGELPDIPMYDYAFVFKYEILKVHRGEIKDKIIYVGHYNPLKARVEAPDGRVENIGGDLKKIKAGDVHHMALELPIDEHYMGGIINRYFEQYKGPIYWAVWTNKASE